MTLAEVWFVIIAVLWTGFLVLEGFDFGVGMLHGVVGRDEAERRSVLDTIAPVWDGNEVWLIVVGAGMFAAFPGWYATMFSAMYLALILLLVALILRGVAIVFRGKREGVPWRRNWSVALTLGSLLAPLLVGVALGDLVHGIPIDSDQVYAGSFWDLLQPYALYTGLTVVLLCLVHGAVFVTLRTRGVIRVRAARAARGLALPAAAAVIGFAVWTQLMVGRGVAAWAAEGIAVVAAVVVVGCAGRQWDGVAFGATAVTIASVVATLFVNLHPRVMVSTLGAGNDLTIANSSSGSYSLTVMTWATGVLLPVVLLYQGWTYHVFRHRVGGTAAVPAAGVPAAPIPVPRAAAEPAGRLPGDAESAPRPPTTSSD